MSNIQNIKPLRNRVLIQRDKPEEKTSSGIYLPDSAREKQQKGKVIALGTGKKDEPFTVKVGDRVLYEEFAHNTCKITQDEEEYLIMPETEIIAII